MKKTALLPGVLMVAISACVGAGFTLLALRHKKQLIALAPGKFVPAQTMQLLDGRHEPLGEIHVTTDGIVTLNLWDANGDPLIMYSTGQLSPALFVYGLFTSQDTHPMVNILMNPEPAFSLFVPDGRVLNTESKSWNRDSIPVAFLKWTYRSVIPEKPETTVEQIIPSEDIRLVDRGGHTFAVLGLSESGEPSIALTNREGRPLAVLSITEPGPLNVGKPKEWPTLALFDRHGGSRITVELGPDPEPKLSINEKADPKNPADWGTYTLDPATGKEIAVKPFDTKATAIPWLAHPMFRVMPPIVLVDQHGSAIWSAR